VKLRTIFILLGAISIAVAACGDDDESSGGLQIVATTGIAADLAEHVAPGASVAQLVPDSASPHDFELSAEDRQTLEEADLVVAIGAGLEASVPLDDVDAPAWELTANTDELLPFTEAGAHDDDEHAEEEGEPADGGTDPHVWMDPTRVAGALPSLADALAGADPAHAGDYRRAAREYAAELRRVDRDVRGMLRVVPAADRELVTSHDSLGYFADRYGFEVVATAFPASGPEGEASAARIAELADAVRATGVSAVFAQQEDDPEALRLVADETGVEIEEGLLIESPGEARTYVEMLRRDADLIAAALG
jgi:zinc/manganese transport system substrate-binding protein